MITHIDIAREHRSFWGMRIFQFLLGRTLYEEYVGLYNATVDEWRTLTRFIAVSREEIQDAEALFRVAREQAAALLDPRRALLTPNATVGADALVNIAHMVTTTFEKTGYHEAARRTSRLASRTVRFRMRLRDLVRDHARANAAMRTSR
ncbi:hypothetical protein HY478_02535 [Candidatus Uhrbacteria bacterium]|nr:hypothetical protein [Candidatus Uhrbacteria bacterium]